EAPAAPTPEEVLAKTKRALNLVCASLPHLAGLAHLARLTVDGRVRTASVFLSGRVLVNPQFATRLNLQELAYVMAHELMHLALNTHGRAGPADRMKVNIAHDYIINDTLTEELGMDPPSRGLKLPGARHLSLEELLMRDPELSRAGGRKPKPKAVKKTMSTTLADALDSVGLAGTPDLSESMEPPEPEPEPEWEDGDDVLTSDLEREWFGDSNPLTEQAIRKAVEESARVSHGLKVLEHAVHSGGLGRGGAPTTYEVSITALQSLYRTPWETALQRWLDGNAPGERTYARPSRRGQFPDLVLPGRHRQGWILHLVVDSSGSMHSVLPKVFGAIQHFCESSQVETIHFLQCDDIIRRDEFLSPQELAHVEQVGGNDNAVADGMRLLAEDTEVRSAVVITDGQIDYPQEPMPYDVLWVLPSANPGFEPSYGTVITLTED
ncbi:MAG: VWA-like domain-containing protein, partial [Limisphaerales bacterium]